MKKLFLIITLLSSFFLAKSQSIQYQYIGTQSTLNRVQARNDFQVNRIFYPGLNDTTFTPSQNGAIITKSSDGQTYNFISNPGGKQWWSWTAQDTLFAKRGTGAVGKFFVLGNPSRIDSAVYLNGGNTNTFTFDSLGGTSGLFFKQLFNKTSLLSTDSGLYRDNTGKVFVAAIPSGVTNLSNVTTPTSDSVKSSTGTPAVIPLAVAGGNAGLLGPNGMTSLSNPLVFVNYRGVGDTILTGAPFADSLYIKAIGHGWGILDTVTQQSITLKGDSNAIKALVGFGSNIYNVNGTLNGSRTLNGNNQSINIGLSSSPLSFARIFSSGGLELDGTTVYKSQPYAVDAPATISVGIEVVELNDANLTANRVITLPTPGTFPLANGAILRVVNEGNNSSFNYTFSPSVTDNQTGSTITTIAHRTCYVLYVDTNLSWRIISKY